MKDVLAARRYAKSIYDRAKEQGQQEILAQDIEQAQAAFKASSELRAVMRSPIVTNEKKLAILKALFEGKLGPLMLQTFELMASKERLQIVEQTLRETEIRYKEDHKIDEAVVTTAAPLDGALADKMNGLLKEKLGSTKVELQHRVNEDILGGYILTFNHQMIDESVRGRLVRLKNNFNKNVSTQQ